MIDADTNAYSHRQVPVSEFYRLYLSINMHNHYKVKCNCYTARERVFVELSNRHLWLADFVNTSVICITNRLSF